MLIPVVVLALVVGGGYFLMPAIDSPQSRLNEQIDRKIELAQRMLNEYNAGGPRLAEAFAAAATRPADIESDKWREYLNLSDENSPFASLKDRVDSQERELARRSEEVSRMSGEEAIPAPLPGPSEAYNQLMGELRSGRALLDKALALVREAISMQEGEGENVASGRDHPTATRLEAILLRHKADLLRRQAALIRAQADLDRQRFSRVVTAWSELQDRIAAQNLLLAGATVPERTRVKHSAAPVQPDATAARPDSAENAADQGSAPRAAKPGFWGWVERGVQRLSSPETPQPQEAPEPQEQPAPEPPPSEPAVAETPSEAPAEAEVIPAEHVPSLADRIAALKQQKTEVAERIESGQAEVDRLDQQIKDLDQRIAAARQQARKAELRMLAAEQKEISGAAATRAFEDEYRSLSRQNREAARDAVILEQGAVRNARSKQDDPEQILTSPLVPTDPAKPMKPERGLVALQDDRDMAATTVKNNRRLLAEIERQIVELTQRRKAVEARIHKLGSEQQELLSDAYKLANSATLAVFEASLLEQQAIDLITGPGQTAAQRAETAAAKYQRDTARFIRSENPTDPPVRKLTEMAGDQFTEANAVAVQGDLNYLLARIYVQQARGLQRHEEMLKQTAGPGIGIKSRPDKLPEGMSPEPVTEYPSYIIVDPAPRIEEDRESAAKAATKALEQYQQAAQQQQDLWVVHANIAAVHDLLADLPRVDGDTEDHVALAREIYARAIQGREARPEYGTYARVIDSLKSQAGKGK